MKALTLKQNVDNPPQTKTKQLKSLQTKLYKSCSLYQSCPIQKREVPAPNQKGYSQDWQVLPTTTCGFAFTFVAL